MNKKVLFIALGILAVGALSGCNKEEYDASYRDVTEGSIYGTISEFSKKKVNSGDVLKFKVTPSDYFSIDSVTNNDERCTIVSNNPDGSRIYQTTIKKGLNKLKALYEVDRDVDFVDEFKLQISDEVFDLVMSKQEGGTDGQSLSDKKKDLDFRRCGIEQASAPNKYVNGEKKARPIDKNDDFFINYVDGDTTHVETFNLGYTVKIRYLNIDTPESTSEIEEWGLTASYFSKYIYSGDEQYWDKVKFSFPDGYEDHLQAGMTSIILLSKEANMHMSEITVDDLKIGSTDKSIYASSTDGNQRDLAYVWYSTKDYTNATPKKEDFRCLNLEMVYQGFSFGVGSSEDTSEFVYKYFDAANLSAAANNRHLNLPKNAGIDENYFYYDGDYAEPIQNLTLEQLYSTAPSDPDIGYLPESTYANKKTLYRIEGYVSTKLKTAFYIQDKQAYDNAAVIAGTEKPYGLYVFTYAENLIRVGDYVSVVGALSSYGGTFQMQGISWHDTPQSERDARIISHNNAITPIKLTGAQFNNLRLPQVMVELTDNIWFYDFQSTYGGEISSLGEGGSEEVNKYNDAYPFYNTSNAPIFYGSFGATDNAQALNDATKGGQGVRYDSRVIRFTVDQDITVTYGIESGRSYRFFTGGDYWYNEGGAEYASAEYVPENCPTEEELEEMFPGDPIAQTAEAKKYQAVHREFNRKYHSVEKSSTIEAKRHGLICISTGYESTGGKRKMTAKIVNATASYIRLAEVTA